MKIIREAFTLSTEPADQQVECIHAYLTKSYWAEGISVDLVRRCVKGSLCVAVLFQGRQVAFARVVTDRATFAYLCDVYVLEDFRGRGLATWMMETIVGHPELQGLRRFMLATRDAHSLYARFGFTPPAKPQSLMEICIPGLYLHQTHGRSGSTR